MPATKRLQQREEKRAEIVAAARRLFLEAGYETTSMSTLAKAAGVAGNTIYWYFADKDDVLVAVLTAVIGDVMVDYQLVANRPLDAQLLWVLAQLQQARRLVNTVHARAAQSPVVNTWHDGFHAMTEALFRSTLEAAGVAGPDLDAEVKIGAFVMEGLLTHELDDNRQRAICAHLARRWTQS